MKKCNSCGNALQDQVKFCTECGSSDFSPIPAETEQVPTDPETSSAARAQTAIPTQPELGNGNVIAGIVGAFLFSLIGGLLYFVIYQIGFIAGICGLVIFVLANFGYTLFAKSDKNCTAGLLVSIIMMVLIIPLSEGACLSYLIYTEFKEFEITFFDAVRAMPDFLQEPEVFGEVLKDVGIAYLLGFIATIGNIVSAFKSKKKSKA